MVNNKKNHKGFTLVEVLIALFLMSVVLVSFASAFGNSYVMAKRGYDITVDTFNAQEDMENAIFDVKSEFVDGTIDSDETVTVFSGDYEADVDIKEVEGTSQNIRNYVAYVTDVVLQSPEKPNMDLEVNVYRLGTTTEVFPWYDEPIEIEAKYSFEDDPKVLKNTTSWYVSKSGIYNPVFPSAYDVIGIDTEVDEPISNNFYFEKINNQSGAEKEILTPGFYYFEARPYTFAGRLAYYSNEDRIPVIEKKGTSIYWQDFIEAVYFEKYGSIYGSQTLKFEKSLDSVHAEVIHNPDHPTLNLGWNEKKDPKGAQIARKLPSSLINNHLEATFTLKVDADSLTHNDGELGFGIYLGNDDNDGIMVDFNIIKDKLTVYKLDDGVYDGYYGTELDIPLVDGSAMDWSKKYDVKLIKTGTDVKVQIFDHDDLTQFSDVVSVAIGTGHDFSYLGLKSYSGLDYIKKDRSELTHKYSRNYGTHFYNIELNVADSVHIIDIADILGVSIPMVGVEPSKSIVENEQYSGVIEWTPDDEKFIADTEYKAIITLTAKDEYTFNGVAKDFFKVSGAEEVTNPINEGVVTAKFKPVSDLISEIKFISDSTYTGNLRNKIYIKFNNPVSEIDGDKIKIEYLNKKNKTFSKKVTKAIKYDENGKEWIVFIENSIDIRPNQSKNHKIVFDKDAFGNDAKVSEEFGTDNQKESYYKIYAKNTKDNIKYLKAVTQDSKTVVQQFSWNDSDANKYLWSVVPLDSGHWPLDYLNIGGGRYRIRNLEKKDKGFIMTDKNPSDGLRNISLGDLVHNTKKKQSQFFFSKNDEYYKIKSVNDDSFDYFDINGNSNADGAQLIGWTNKTSGDDNQNFKFEIILKDK